MCVILWLKPRLYACAPPGLVSWLSLPPGPPVPHHDDLLREQAAVVVVDPDAHLVAPFQVVGGVELSLEADRCTVVITHRDRAAPVRIRDLQGLGVGVDRAD